MQATHALGLGLRKDGGGGAAARPYLFGTNILAFVGLRVSFASGRNFASIISSLYSVEYFNYL
jgi:hypothetical protein